MLSLVKKTQKKRLYNCSFDFLWIRIIFSLTYLLPLATLGILYYEFNLGVIICELMPINLFMVMRNFFCRMRHLELFVLSLIFGFLRTKCLSIDDVALIVYAVPSLPAQWYNSDNKCKTFIIQISWSALPVSHSHKHWQSAAKRKKTHTIKNVYISSKLG